MTRADMDRVRDDFVRAARCAAEAGFDWLELHCAHGYLLSSLHLAADQPARRRVRRHAREPAALPARSVRRGARRLADSSCRCRCASRRTTGSKAASRRDDAVEIARAFKAAGADMIDCSSGQVSATQKPVYGRMYQTPFADRIRNEAGIATIAVGAISEADHVNSIIAAGRADLCAMARPHLANPAWTLTEAAQDRLHRRRLAASSTARPSRRWSATSCASARWRRTPAPRREAGPEPRARRYRSATQQPATTRRTPRSTMQTSAWKRQPASDDHLRCKLWLRLLDVHARRSRPKVRAAAARAVRHHAGALRLPGAAAAPSRRACA